MSELYSTTSRQLHDLSDTRRFADVARRVIVHDRFTAEDKAFIEKLD